MCGICGKMTINGARIEEDLLRRMNAVLTHRGPDDEGLHIDHCQEIGIGLAHRRLSIIDLSSAGRQPMTNEDGMIWIIFNGEIYNFIELREELLAKGHRFRSQTDTEVLIHLYEEEGTNCVNRLIGMFAFAIWDRSKKKLFLARDHIGIKPLVYAWDGKSFTFASEVKAILQDPNFTRSMDRHAFSLYLSLNYIPAPYSIFEGIKKLQPGHTITLQDGKVSESAYWNIDLAGSRQRQADHIDDLKADLFQILDDAVKRQMIADVPLGAFLSGGIDSSIIVALMARHSSMPVKTFSIGFADMPMYDETEDAKSLARMYATDHHEIRLTSRQILDVIPDVFSGFDEPFADSSAIPSFIVSRETRREVKVALSGDGGDELFAGYRMYRGEGLYGQYRRMPHFIRKNLIEPLIRHLPDSRDNILQEYLRRIKKFLRGTGESLEERFLSWNEIFTPDAQKSLLIQEFDRPPRNVFAGRLREMEDDPVNRMLYADFKESLPGDMLRKVDAMGMMNSLEIRVPLLDHRVCEAAFAISGSWKLHHGRSKYVFIETFKDLLPRSLLAKPKWGFEIPISAWLKSDLKNIMEDYCSMERIRGQGIFNYLAVHSLMDQLTLGRSDTSWQLWNLIAFQVWHERYF